MLEQAPLAPRCAQGWGKGVCVLPQACMAGHPAETALGLLSSSRALKEHP